MIYELGSRGRAVVLAHDKHFLRCTQKFSETFYFISCLMSGNIQQRQLLLSYSECRKSRAFSGGPSLDKTAETPQDIRLSLFTGSPLLITQILQGRPAGWDQGGAMSCDWRPPGHECTCYRLDNFPSLPPSLPLPPLKAAPEQPLPGLSSGAGRTPGLGRQRAAGSRGAQPKPPLNSHL